MNTKLIRAVPFALLGLAGLAGAETAAEHHVLTGGAAIKWGPPPPVFPSGAKFAVVDGDPAAKGLVTVRFMMPAGYQIAPHWHPTDEHITVLSGTLSIGMGDKLDMDHGKTLKAGG
jgi:quercetin dioxygenase-like cupin family protein